MQKDVILGYSSVDRPSEKFYEDNIVDKILSNTDMKMYDFMKEKNKGFENCNIYSYFGETDTFSSFDKKVEECAKA